MPEINLLKSYPKTKRDLTQRQISRTADSVALARRYGEDYFDGSRETGYGGYHYDGRWLPVANDLYRHYHLWPGERLLDVGCAKGFLVRDLVKQCRVGAFGIDISDYAIRNCHEEVVGRLHLGSCIKLPFPDNSFGVVTAINVLHDLSRELCIEAIREIQRVGTGRAYIQVDAYHNEAEKQTFLNWVLTARTHGTPEFWQELFTEAGYTGDFYYTFVE